MSDLSIQDLQAEPDPETTSRPDGESVWHDLRHRILEALEEDPLNTAMLARHLDHRDASLANPHERVLASLIGMSPGAAESRRLLELALEARAASSRDRGRPVPLRLALLELLMAENRHRVDPWLADLRLSAGLSTGSLADPVKAATSLSAINGAVQAELRRARRFKVECALVRVGLDDWHDLVWRAGTAAAERALGAAALVIKNEIRDVDWAVRTPDHDLVIMLSGTGRFGALLVANRVLAKLGRLRLPGSAAGEPPRASLGIAAYPVDARFGWELMATACNAMFRARADGGGGISDQGMPSARRFIRVAPESVRIVVRTLSVDPESGQDEPAGDGIVFTSPLAYDIGGRLELECIEVSGQGRAVLTGRVVHLEERVDGQGYDVGVACHIEPDEAGFFRERSARQAR
jgi:diguanylate cyclase (GGDEF)-like protein